MSNLFRPFGNEGWIQSSIDRSRGKTRDIGKHNAARNKAERQAALHADSALLKKHPSDSDTALPKRQLKGGISGAIQRALLKKNDPLVKKYGSG